MSDPPLVSPAPHTGTSMGCTREAPGGRRPTGVSGDTVLASQKLELPPPYSLNHSSSDHSSSAGPHKAAPGTSVFWWISAMALLCQQFFVLLLLFGPGSFSGVFPPHLAPAKRFLAVFLKLPCPRSSSLKGAHCTPCGRCLCTVCSSRRQKSVLRTNTLL